MIEKNTVLVLGAGASSPFGFPLGRELKERIARDLSRPSETELGRCLMETNLQDDQLVDFATRLERSPLNSVDAFLEKDNNHKYEYAGKMAIIASIMALEKPDVFRDGNWYKLLVNALCLNAASAESFQKNKLRIITFNYERSVEFYLSEQLLNVYDIENEQERANIILRTIPIVHFYGKIGGLLEWRGKRRPYKPTVTSGMAAQWVNEIKIIHNSVEGELQIAEAHKLLRDAEVICFLGFGFERNNLERLLKPPGILNGKSVFCSAFKLKPAEVGRAKAALAQDVQIEWGSDDEDCLKFLVCHCVLI